MGLPARCQAVSCPAADPERLPTRIHDMSYDIWVYQNANSTWTLGFPVDRHQTHGTRPLARVPCSSLESSCLPWALVTIWSLTLVSFEDHSSEWVADFPSRADGGIALGGGFRRPSVQPNWLGSSFRQVALRWQTSWRSEEASARARAASAFRGTAWPSQALCQTSSLLPRPVAWISKRRGARPTTASSVV